MRAHSTTILGVDFSCAPSRRKPITVARAALAGGVLRIERVDELPTLAAFEALLAEPGPWVGGFDFPFGLPRAFVDAQGLRGDAQAVAGAVRGRCADRRSWQALIDGWGNAQPAGARLLHRRTDGATPGIRSTSPLQTRYVPVGFMYYEGFARLLDAGVHLPGQRRGDEARTALEVWPGLMAHHLIGRRSYKNTDDAGRLLARKDLLHALEIGHAPLAQRLKFSPALGDAILADPSGDRLDAVLCAAWAAWALSRPGWGLPDDVDPVEGWITGMPHACTA